MILNSCSIAGMGWLGFALAEKLKKEGISIAGTSTNREKIEHYREKGFDCHYFDLLEDPELPKKILEKEILFFNVPPSDFKNFDDTCINFFKEYEMGFKLIIFVGSTSVYGKQKGQITENSELQPISDNALALRNIEHYFEEECATDYLILRPGGLVGYDRLPGAFMSFRPKQASSHSPVNYIHRDDLVEIIFEMINQDVRNDDFNLVADEHPSRIEYYKKAAEALNVDPPKFSKQGGKDEKRISNEKVKEKLNYSFKYPDPLKMLDQLLEESK